MIETGEIIKNAETLSYLGIFGISILANVIIPVPEEIVLLVLGYVAGTGKINIFLVGIICFLGLLISDLVMFLLARKGARFLQFMYDKFFSKGLASRTQWLDEHINKVIFFSRFMIQLRFLGPFLAGHKKISIYRFLKFDVLALFIYVPLYLFLGFYFHARINKIVSGVNDFKNIVLILVGVAVLFSVYKFFKRRLLGK